MAKLFVFLLAIVLFASGQAAAAEPDLRVKMISGALKGMANAFIASGDIEKQRSIALRELEGMNEEKFRKGYAEAYPFIERLPDNLKSKYGINGSLTLEQVKGKIRSLKKEDIYELINSVPDEVVAQEFDRYWNEASQKMKSVNLPQQIQQVWKEFSTEVQRLERKHQVTS